MFPPPGEDQGERKQEGAQKKSLQLTGPRPHFLDHCSQFSHILPHFLTHLLCLTWSGHRGWGQTGGAKVPRARGSHVRR